VTERPTIEETDWAQVRYYVAFDGEPWQRVDKAGFVFAERAAGFHNTLGEAGEPATAGFGWIEGGREIKGKIEYPHLDGDGAQDPRGDK